MSTTGWTEDAYLDHLAHERYMYAWCLRVLGGVAPAEAERAAHTFYFYEPADAPFRCHVFHDEAWNWALLHLHGELYWIGRPDLASPSDAYRQESERRFPFA